MAARSARVCSAVMHSLYAAEHIVCLQVQRLRAEPQRAAVLRHPRGDGRHPAGGPDLRGGLGGRDHRLLRCAEERAEGGLACFVRIGLPASCGATAALPVEALLLSCWLFPAGWLLRLPRTGHLFESRNSPRAARSLALLLLCHCPLPHLLLLCPWHAAGRPFEARNKPKGSAFSGEDKDFFRFKLGDSSVIPAFNEAVAGMKVGRNWWRGRPVTTSGAAAAVC